MSLLSSIDRLGVRYPGEENWVLDQVSLELYQGKVSAIIGPSGCGKTSLVRTACGLIPHCIPADYRGSVRLDDIEMAEAEVAHIATRIGFVGQSPDAAIITRCVHDEVCFPLQNLCLPRDEVEERALAALQMVGLADHLWDDPWLLSGGQRQRLALAAALAMRPRLLVLDEPTSTIDTAGRADFYRLLPPLIAEGMGVLVIDHDLDPLLPIIDHITALDAEGRTIGTGTPDEVYRVHGAELAAAGIWMPRALRSSATAGLTVPQLSDFCGTGEVRYLAKVNGNWQQLADLDTTEPGRQARSVLADFSVPQRSPKISARLAGGELIALIGENGSGKSSLLGALAGIVNHSGQASIDQQPVKAGDSRLGYVFQNPEHQFVTTTVAAELAFGSADPARTEQLLDHFHLQDHQHKHPLTLSGGQSRRLSVATMASQEKTLIALDEPTYGQDWANTCELMSFIDSLRADGASVIMATHDLELARDYASHIIALPLQHQSRRQPSQPPRPNSSLLGSLNPFAMLVAIVLPAVLVIAQRDISTNLAIMALCSLLMATSQTGWRRILTSIGVVWIAAALMTWAVSTIINPDFYTGIRGIGNGWQTGSTIGALLGLMLASGIATNPEAILRAATRQLHLPYRLASAGTAALAFLGRFRQDFLLLRTARALRGVGRRWGIFAPAIRWVSAIVPLMITSVQHGERVALSMDSRAFGAFDNRTELIDDPWRWRDTLVVTIGWLAAGLAWFY